MERNDRKYLASHEWAKLAGDTAVVGLSNHAQEELGDITYVELPEVGATVEQGQECGTIESVKAASDLYSPLGGVVVEINEKLETEPEIINDDPYEAGWMFKLSGVDAAQMDQLLDADAYQKALESQE